MRLKFCLLVTAVIGLWAGAATAQNPNFPPGFPIASARQTVLIASVQVDTLGPVYAGYPIQLTLRGTPGGQATYTVGSRTRNMLMETSAGVYEGTYVARFDDVNPRARVTGYLFMPDGRYDSRDSGTVALRGDLCGHEAASLKPAPRSKFLGNQPEEAPLAFAPSSPAYPVAPPAYAPAAPPPYYGGSYYGGPLAFSTFPEFLGGYPMGFMATSYYSSYAFMPGTYSVAPAYMFAPPNFITLAPTPSYLVPFTIPPASVGFLEAPGTVVLTPRRGKFHVNLHDNEQGNWHENVHVNMHENGHGNWHTNFHENVHVNGVGHVNEHFNVHSHGEGGHGHAEFHSAGGHGEGGHGGGHHGR